MPSLYELTADLHEIERALIDSEGELTPEIELKLAALDIEVAEKVDGYRCVVARFESDARAIEEEQRLLTAKKQAVVNAATRLKERLKAYMDERGLTEIKGIVWKAAIQKNGGKPALKVLVEPTELPRQYQVISADTEALRAGIRAGEVETTIAVLEPIGTHLRFR